MSTFQYDVPDDQLKQLGEDFVLVYEWTPEIEVLEVQDVTNNDGTISQQPVYVKKPNPVSPNQLVLNKVQDFIKDVSRAADEKRRRLKADSLVGDQKPVDVTITVL